MKRLIVTADDFGRCREINDAVFDAHDRGILTSASLMVGGDAADDAIHRARAVPSLAVGLHATLVDGRPLLPPAQIPDLVGTDGRFRSDVVALGSKIYFSRRVQAQASAELRAQFGRFQASGLAFDHVDSHHHYHLHPTVCEMVIQMAAAFGAKALRIPFEPPIASWRARRTEPVKRLATGILHWRATRKMRAAARRAGLAVNDRVFGFCDSGSMDAEALLDFLDVLPDGVSELYCHPATAPWAEHPMPPSYCCVAEYQALIDERVIDRVRRGDILLAGYSGHALA